MPRDSRISCLSFLRLLSLLCIFYPVSPLLLYIAFLFSYAIRRRYNRLIAFTLNSIIDENCSRNCMSSVHAVFANNDTMLDDYSSLMIVH